MKRTVPVLVLLQDLNHEAVGDGGRVPALPNNVIHGAFWPLEAFMSKIAVAVLLVGALLPSFC